MGQSGKVGSHTVKVCRNDASAMVRPLDASGAATPPTTPWSVIVPEGETDARKSAP